MIDARQRLIGCFKAVFPGLSENELARASVSSVGSWDSVATVTLVATIEEEFGIQFGADEVEKIDSFQKCLSRVDKK